MIVTLALAYIPLADALGFQALDLPYLAAMLGIALLYLMSAEMVKRWFFRHVSAERARQLCSILADESAERHE